MTSSYSSVDIRNAISGASEEKNYLHIFVRYITFKKEEE